MGFFPPPEVQTQVWEGWVGVPGGSVFVEIVASVARRYVVATRGRVDCVDAGARGGGRGRLPAASASSCCSMV